MDAERAFEGFLNTDDLMYPKATACLQKDREALLTRYVFPGRPLAQSANHESHRIDVWDDSPPDNPHEGVSHPWRHMLHRMWKLGQCEEKTWRGLRGFRELPKVSEGIQFTDGIEQRTNDPVAA